MALATEKKPRTSWKPALTWRIGKYSRSKMYHKREICDQGQERQILLQTREEARSGGSGSQTSEVLPRRRRQDSHREPPQAQAHQAQGEHNSGDGVDSAGGEVHGEEGGLPQTARFGIASCHWYSLFSNFQMVFFSMLGL
ncbi:60S ribosomal protein L6 [Acorus gramineus]|uniref:60S ribosomal protein L6 n=1 Tax=Acorus gramineus TaxID=55184 RepID=A0AAV9A2N1_ACOGR|nr:60S ribosomal protein L6 [Acorus gramineus]